VKKKDVLFIVVIIWLVWVLHAIDLEFFTTQNAYFFDLKIYMAFMSIVILAVIYFI